MIKKFQIITLLGLLLMVISITPFVAKSQVAQAECPAVITQSILKEKQAFYETLTSNINTAQPTSETLSNIFTEYRKFLQSINSQYTDDVSKLAEQGTILGDSESQTCTRFINAQKQQISETLLISLKSSSSLKQTYNLVEKYSHINSKFNQFQSDLNKVQRDLKTFSQKLPCYSSSCVQE